MISFFFLLLLGQSLALFPNMASGLQSSCLSLSISWDDRPVLPDPAPTNVQGQGPHQAGNALLCSLASTSWHRSVAQLSDNWRLSVTCGGGAVLPGAAQISKKCMLNERMNEWSRGFPLLIYAPFLSISFCLGSNLVWWKLLTQTLSLRMAL